MAEINLHTDSVRSLNEALQGAASGDKFSINNTRGKHAVSVGLTTAVNVEINGHVGYYCAGMNQQANITIKGNAGPGLAENMMSGKVHVTGNASQYAGATAHGGLLVIEGDASSRCGISMKGVNIVVGGNIGHMSAFMAQSGCLVVCGDAGDALGDSIYEARLYVRGHVASLGTDCIEKEMRAEHTEQLESLLQLSGMNHNVNEFRRYGSARKLYNFDINQVDAY
ncbi:MAG: protein glxC [Gammaproteobacteria bacterium]